MCQWCVGNPKCPCQVECEVALKGAHIAGDMQIICPTCKHSVVRELFLD